MYKRMLLTLTWALFLMAPFIAPAQLSIQPADIEHDKKMRPSLEVQLEPGADRVKEAWRDFIKDNYDVKLKGIGFLANKDLMTAEEVKFKALSDKKMNFYTRAVEQNGMTRMNIFASFGYDIYLNPIDNPTAWRTLESMTHDFLKTFLQKYYEEDISTVQATIANLQNEQKNMSEELEKNRKEIEKLTKRNEELSKKVTESETASAAAYGELAKKEKNFNQVKTQLQLLGGIQ